MSDTPMLLSVTAVLGHDTIFSDTPLSRQFGLEQGDPVPLVVHPKVLFLVESAVEQVERLEPSGVRRFREGLGMTPEEFARFVDLDPEVTARWESEGTQPAVFVHRKSASPEEGVKMTQEDFAKSVELNPDTMAFLEIKSADREEFVKRVVLPTDDEEPKGRIYHGLLDQDFDPDDIPRHPRKQR